MLIHEMIFYTLAILTGALQLNMLVLYMNQGYLRPCS